jgi:outer membrane lipoprotein-sorting protein
MIAVFTCFRHRSLRDHFLSYISGWSLFILILAAWLPAGCTRFSALEIQRDMAAEQMVAELRQTNADLTRFKCVGKMTLSGPKGPAQSFRAGMAGQLPDRLRIDMFAPFGGSAGTVSSDGKHLFLVMHPSHEYYKRRFGSGSLQHMIQIDVTVGDLLELLVGRIPMNDEFSARLTSDENKTKSQLVLVDRWGRTRQRVTIDDSMHPVASVWFDSHQNPLYSLTVTGMQAIDGFILPKRIDLSGASGERVSVTLDRFEANASFDESLFVPAPSSS